MPVEAGYLNDLHYPCVVDFKRAITVACISVLAHAMAGAAFQSAGLPGSIGIILNLELDLSALRRAGGSVGRIRSPICCSTAVSRSVASGRYPAALLHLLERHGLMPLLRAAGWPLIEGGGWISSASILPAAQGTGESGRRAEGPIASPEDLFSYYAMPGRKINPHRGWEIYEKGLYDILMDLKRTTAICLVIFPKTAWASRAKRRLSAPMGGWRTITASTLFASI